MLGFVLSLPSSYNAWLIVKSMSVVFHMLVNDFPLFIYLFILLLYVIWQHEKIFFLFLRKILLGRNYFCVLSRFSTIVTNNIHKPE